MSIAARINKFLSHFGYIVTRLENVRKEDTAPVAFEAPPAPEPAADRIDDLLAEISNTRLDLSAAVIATLKDIRIPAQIAAGQSSASWIARWADGVKVDTWRRDMLDRLCTDDLPAGDIAEFGVFTGAVTHFLRPRFPERAYHAFDSFLGVPGAMGLTIHAGDFSLSGAIPPLPADVVVHAGWFDETLPKFCDAYRGQLAFVYIDCDLYSSVKTVLDHILDKLAVGAIVAFDDWYNFPNWEAHSYRAFLELVARTGARFTPVGLTAREHAVAFRYDGCAPAAGQ